MARDGPGLAVLAVFADAGPQDFRAHQGRHAAHHVHGGGAGEIVEAQLGQPAAAPDPVAGDGVDDGADHQAVDQIRGELGPLRHRAGDNGGGGGAEHRLEDDERARGERLAVIAADKEVQPADERPVPRKHQPEADGPEDQGAHREIHQVFHDDIPGVFRPGEAGFHHGEPGLHEEDEHRPQQYPNGVQCRKHTAFLLK